jgi:glycosyltransferase involved in cell wall biosynthesis
MKISLITPSYNQGEYIEKTLSSVLSQSRSVDYYEIRDSCSEDATKDVLGKYREDSRVTIIVEKDRGQADALNRGFANLPEDIDVMGYLNSDDVLLPGAIEAVMAEFERDPDLDVVSGGRFVATPDLRVKVRVPVLPMRGEGAFAGISVFQEATFWRRRLYERVGGHVDTSLRFAMDYELFLRMFDAKWNIRYLDRPLAIFRIHPKSKTSSQINDLGLKEINVLRGRYGRPPLSGAEWAGLTRSVRRQEYGLLRHLAVRFTTGAFNRFVMPAYRA